MQEIKYNEFSLGLHERYGKKRLPLRGTFDLTFRCNLRCVHCYCPTGDKEQELNFGEIVRIMDEISNEGCVWLVLTGGEPLLRKDFSDIYLYAKKKGFITTLLTNGTLIDEKTVNLLKQYPPFSIEISIYGATEETYESVTQVKGSFGRCINGINLILQKKLPLKLKTMVLTINKHEIFDMKRFAQKKGLSFRYDAMINPRLDKNMMPCKYRIKPQEIIELDRGDSDRYNELIDVCERLWGPPGNELFYTCGAGLVQFQIGHYGKLDVCAKSREPHYDLRKGSFREGWYKEFPKIIFRKPKGEYICGDCEFGVLCGYCPGWSDLENNGKETPVEFLCKVGHLRAQMLNLQKGEDSLNEENKKTI